MGIPSAMQCRIFSPDNGGPDNGGGRVSNWSLPVWMLATCSYSVSMALGLEGPFVAVHARVAREMNIRDGYKVEFEIVQAGERFIQKVVVKDNIPADVIVHGAGLLNIAKGEAVVKSIVSPAENSYSLILKSGNELTLPLQEIWSGMKLVYLSGSAVLYFDGASRNNPHGPSGYGFHIVNYRSSNYNNNSAYRVHTQQSSFTLASFIASTISGPVVISWIQALASFSN